MAVKWKELRARMNPEARARSAAHSEAMLVELKLAEVRRNQDRTQVEVAQTMDEKRVVFSELADVQATEEEFRLIAPSPGAEIEMRPECESSG